jgi:hydroxymethylpyrimidine pyrophosphatase-like HAD family hydrolase
MNYLALASDYDGTLALDGRVSELTLAKLRILKKSGRKIILVTGRELPELLGIFPEIDVCDVVVAENGAILYWPHDQKEEILGEAPTPEFIAEMDKHGVLPYSVGRVIFATWRPHESIVLEVIQRLGLGYQIIFNKRAVMVLPSAINKATGLAKALERLEIAGDNCVGVGDAENDFAFLDICGVAAAVDNALPSLKSRCDLVTSKDHGSGVEELMDQMLADDLQHLGRRRARKETVERSVEHGEKLQTQTAE